MKHTAFEKEDDILSEMRTLNVRPELKAANEEIARSNSALYKSQIIDQNLKIKILEWLTNDIRLLKPVSGEKQIIELIGTFPQYCRTGVIFADLINRLNGKIEVIKGIIRQPQNNNLSQI